MKFDRVTAAAKDVISGLISEGKYAHAAAILFSHHKERLLSWVNLKADLLSSATDHSQLFIIASLIEVSTKDTLDESCHLVPGLYSFLNSYDDDY